MATYKTPVMTARFVLKTLIYSNKATVFTTLRRPTGEVSVGSERRANITFGPIRSSRV